MRNYELVCIIQPELDETAFKGVVDRVSGWIKSTSELERNIRFLEPVLRHMLSVV
jgi:ribosomal protein S6